MISSRLRTAAAGLVLALVTAVPVVSAHRAPAPRLGDPVVVERMPRPPAGGPSARPYEDGARPTQSSPPPVPHRHTGQPAGTRPSGAVSDAPETPPTRPPTTSDSLSTPEAEPVPPAAPLPASSRDTGTPSPTGAPSDGSTDGDDESDGDDGRGDGVGVGDDGGDDGGDDD